MVILQLKLHTQPQEQLEQVAQGCGQLGFKCLNGWRLHLKRHVTGFDQKCYKKKKYFLIFKFYSLYFSSCTLPFVPSLDTTDANLTTDRHHLLACAAETSIKPCTERSGSIHQRKQQIYFKQSDYKPAARSQR